MAFTPDAFNTGITENDTNAQTQFVLNVGSLTRGLLVVAVGWSTTATNISNANFRGQFLHPLVKHSVLRASAILFMYDPPSGISTGTINFSANGGRVNIEAGSWDGADNTYNVTGTVGSTAAFNGTDGAPLVTVPTVGTDYLVVDSAALAFGAGETLTVGANQTERGKISGGATITGFSSQNGTDGGEMSWTDSNNTRPWTSVAAAFRPFTEPAGGLIFPVISNGIQSPLFGGRVVR